MPQEIGAIRCPFCFKSFSPQQILFRCVQPRVRCPGWERDEKYARARNIPVTEMGHIFEASTEKGKTKLPFRVPQSAPCDKCFVESHTRLCPECHFELSHDIDQIKQRFIAVVGGRVTGKSHYIGSLIFTLSRSRSINFTINMLNDSTQERWRRDFYLPVFEHRTMIPGTQTALVDTRVKNPLVVRLTSHDSQWKRKMQGLWDQAINAYIFDSAGEDLVEKDTMVSEDPAILHAHGLIFMIDPLQIEKVQHALDKLGIPAERGDPRSNPENMLDRIIQSFEQYGGVKNGTGKISVPTAFVLSKVDVLESIAYAGASFLQPSSHAGELNLAQIQSVSSDVKDYLDDWLLPSFSKTIAARFSSYSFFGVSALGKQPDIRSGLEVVEPLRVEEPFLWLLYKLGFIKGR